MNTVQCTSTKYRIGQPLGNYTILSHLADGGYSTVYKAQHRYLGTFAVIKITNNQVEGDNRQQFLAEARIAASLIHPNIIRTLDFGIDQNCAYLIMDYAPNSTMSKCYPFGTRLSPPSVVQRVHEVSVALHYMHSKNLIHCDIKPENMLLDSNDRILLCDFGITIFANRPVIGESIVGTVTYMAPEQFMGYPCFASDQYSLAVAAYSWLCGEPPFKGSPEQIAQHHLAIPPPPLRDKIPTLAPAIEEVILMALSKKPEQRFSNVMVFAQELADACSAQHTMQAFFIPPEDRQRRLILPDPQGMPDSPVPRRPRNRMATPKELIKMLLLDLSIGSIVFILLSIIGIPFGTFWFFVMLCLASLPLGNYIRTKNNIMAICTALSLLIAFIIGLSLQSATFFEFFYSFFFSMESAVFIAVRLRETRGNQQ